jgi:hypothetical protein
MFLLIRAGTSEEMAKFRSFSFKHGLAGEARPTDATAKILRIDEHSW